MQTLIQVSENGINGEPIYFFHPFFSIVAMFFGESLVILLYFGL